MKKSEAHHFRFFFKHLKTFGILLLTFDFKNNVLSKSVNDAFGVLNIKNQ